MEPNNFDAPPPMVPTPGDLVSTNDATTATEQDEAPTLHGQPREDRGEDYPSFLLPQDGQSFDDAVEVLDPEYEDEPLSEQIIPGSEWPALDGPPEYLEGYEDAERMADDPVVVPTVPSSAAADPAAYQAQVITAFKAAMAARGLVPPSALQADGSTHRCDVQGQGGEGDGSYQFNLDAIPSGGFQNWKDGKGWQSWRFEFGPGELLSPEKMRELRKDADAQRKVREAEVAEEMRKARETAQAIWRHSLPCTEHPYLTRKGIQPHGVRQVSSGFRRGQLVLPIRDSQGVVHSIQTIDDSGAKHFLKNGRKKGCCFPIGQPKKMIFIAEGFATAASIHEATGEAVLVAFDCGNLRPVAEAINAAFPQYSIVLAADDDYLTEGNPGMTKALEAAKVVGAKVVVPDFGAEMERPVKATDFNDLHQLRGLDVVRECIEQRLAEEATNQDSLPEILVNDRRQFDVLTDVFSILVEQKRVFLRGEQLIHVSIPRSGTLALESVRPMIVPATPAWMRLELSRVADYFRVDKKGSRSHALVPDWVSKLTLEMVDFQGLQSLHTLAETPVVLKDGTIHDCPGFDPSTGIYYVPNGEFPAFPPAPTLDDAKSAVAALFELVSDFPFADATSKAAWLALLLTIPARFAIPGPVPFWLIDANGQSAGKGLLTHLTSIIALGRNPVAMVGSRDPEEFKKNLLCTLMEGRRLAWLDEAESPFGGRSWNSLMTAYEFQDRILGVSKQWSGPHFTTWVVTGNNVEMTTDTPRRCVHVRLEPSEERPEDRGGFRIPDIIAHTRKHRAELFSLLLTILRAYHLAGRPRHDLTTFGMFEEWSNLVRECVFWCTGVDCDTRKELTATADPTREMSSVVIEQLAELFPGQRTFLASEVMAAYEAKDFGSGGWLNSHLHEALDTLNTNPKGVNAKGIGNMLKSKRDRNVGGWILRGVPGGKHGMVYRIDYAGPELPKQEGNVEPLKTLGDSTPSFEVDFSTLWAKDRTTPQLITPPGEAGGAGLPGYEAEIV